jgi:hypothetical protein
MALGGEGVQSTELPPCSCGRKIRKRKTPFPVHIGIKICYKT